MSTFVARMSIAPPRSTQTPFVRVVGIERRGGTRDLALIAEDHVLAGVAVDDVVAGTTEEDVVAVAAEDRVDAAVFVRESDRLDHADQELVDGEARLMRVRHVGVRGEPGVVAEHEVLALPGDDRVVLGAADHDVVAFTGGDDVVAAEVRAVVERRDHLDVVRVVDDRQVVEQVVDEAVVTEQDVVAIECGAGLSDVGDDRVAAPAAEDHVAAEAGADHVVTAVLTGRREPLDQLEHGDRIVVASMTDRLGIGRLKAGLDAGDPAVVAEHDVLARAGVDQVAPAPPATMSSALPVVIVVDATQGDVDALHEVEDRHVGRAGDVLHAPVVAEDHVGLRRRR